MTRGDSMIDGQISIDILAPRMCSAIRSCGLASLVTLVASGVAAQPVPENRSPAAEKGVAQPTGTQPTGTQPTAPAQQTAPDSSLPPLPNASSSALKSGEMQDRSQEVVMNGTALLARVQQMYQESLERGRSPKTVETLSQMRAQVAAEVDKAKRINRLLAESSRSGDKQKSAEHYDDMLVKQLRFERWEKELNSAVAGTNGDSPLTDTESKLQVRVDERARKAKRYFVRDDAVPLFGYGGASSVQTGTSAAESTGSTSSTPQTGSPAPIPPPVSPAF